MAPTPISTLTPTFQVYPRFLAKNFVPPTQETQFLEGPTPLPPSLMTEERGGLTMKCASEMCLWKKGSAECCAECWEKSDVISISTMYRYYFHTEYSGKSWTLINFFKNSTAPWRIFNNVLARKLTIMMIRHWFTSWKCHCQHKRCT